MSPPKDRKRKFHRRSKAGCIACKKRHVRCDERKPLCTYCLHNGKECAYPDVVDVTELVDLQSHSGVSTLLDMTPNHALVGHSIVMPNSSRWLFNQFSTFSVQGGKGVERGNDTSAVQKALSNPGLLHASLSLSACQLAWIVGSLEKVKVPFLYHKAATYQFVKEQLRNPETATSDSTLWAIACLAITEGSVGDLDAASKHLRGIKQVVQARSRQTPERELGLAQRMLDMAGNCLRHGHRSELVINLAFQPTVIALVFTSIFDLETLPRRAPEYGWWEEANNPRERLWLDCTAHLDYEVARDFDPQRDVGSLLNNHPVSSKTSFIATFFYIFVALQSTNLDSVLTFWLLEQLTDDINEKEKPVQDGSWSSELWFWSVMFGAAVAASCRPLSSVETRQLEHFQDFFTSKIRTARELWQIAEWEDVQERLVYVMWGQDAELDDGIKALWERAIQV